MKEIVYHTNYQLEDSYWWFLARREIIGRTIKKTIEIKPDEYILDVGCGTCGMAEFLSKDFNIVAIDTSELALEYCKKRGLENAFQSTLENFPRNKYKIKAITILDVIEHIQNDGEIVLQLYETLPVDGYLIVSVPAYQFLWSFHDEVHKHFRRYTLKSLRSLIKSAGFQVEFATYFNTFLFPFALLKRFIDIVFNIEKKNEYAIEILPKPINTLFTKIFEFEKYFIPKVSFPFGLSILLIAKKIR